MEDVTGNINGFVFDIPSKLPVSSPLYLSTNILYLLSADKGVVLTFTLILLSRLLTN